MYTVNGEVRARMGRLVRMMDLFVFRARARISADGLFISRRDISERWQLASPGES